MKKNFKVGDNVTFSARYSTIITNRKRLVSGIISEFDDVYAVVNLDEYYAGYFGINSCKVPTEFLMDTTEYGDLENMIKEIEESIQDKQDELKSLKSQIIY